MSKSGPVSKSIHHDAYRRQDVGRRGQSIRGALVLLVAATVLVSGAYYIVLSLTGPDGFITHMASNASVDVDSRTQALASEN